MDWFSQPLMESLLQKWVVNGGILMWALVPCSLLMVGGIIQGIFSLRRGRVMPRALLKKAQLARDVESRQGFIQGLRIQETPLARLLWLTLKDYDPRAGQPDRAALETRLEETVALVGDDLMESVGLLSTIYTIAPLLGLLGTILGLTDTFYRFGVLQETTISSLSIGVQEALITTVWGLYIAIPAFIAVQWMQKKIRRYERYRFPAMVDTFVEVLYNVPAPRSEARALAQSAAHATAPLHGVAEFRAAAKLLSASETRAAAAAGERD